MSDLKARVIRCIGDPDVRFQEDPVRICRGIRFSVHLGFQIEEITWSAMLEHGAKVGLCPFPRVQEEMLRLMRTGRMAEGFLLYHKTGVLKSVIPEVDEILQEEQSASVFWSILDTIGQSFTTDRPLDDFVLWTSVLMKPVFNAMDKADSEADAAVVGYEYLRETGARLSIPKAVRSDALQLLLDVRNMMGFPGGKKAWRRKNRLFAHQEFKTALKLLDAYIRATEEDHSLVERWKRDHSIWLRRRSASRSRTRKKRISKKNIKKQHRKH